MVGEDVRTFASRLQRLARDTLSREEEGDQLRKKYAEDILKEEMTALFVAGLQDPVRRFVLSRKPSNFDQAVEAALDEERNEALTTAAARVRVIERAVLNPEVALLTERLDRLEQLLTQQVERQVEARAQQRPFAGNRRPPQSYRRVGSLEKVYSRVAVRLVEEAVVLPWSEHILYAFVPSDVESGAVGVLEPVDSLSNGLKAAACLVTVNDAHRVPLRVVNCSQQPLSLPKNKTLAFFTSAIEQREPTDTVLATVEHASPSAAPKVSFDLSHVKSREREALAGLLNDYSEVFAASNLDLGCCGVIKHRIETGTSSPVYQRAYRIPYSQREEMERQVQDLIDRGIVEHSKSPWGAPALLVEKPDGSYRLVVDYRKLNAVTRIDPYPIPNIQETLSQLGSARYFTVVDMAAGFWQIAMDPADAEKTAFNTPSGHYEWKRMPMGLANSPAVWQRTADVILAGLLGRLCFVYMDDIIIYSDSFDNHLRDIEQVLVRLRAAGLKLKPSKCQFLKNEVKYLGHVVSADGVRPDPEKLRCVSDFPSPTSVRQVRQFLGLIGYYRRHIEEFAKLAKPLTALTAKNVAFRWDENAENAFGALKRKLMSAPLLRHPDFSLPFVMATDASKFAVGAVLSQVIEGKEHPVAFASRQLSPTEQKYGATERECLAVVWAVKHFRCYLYGRKFKLVTDCHPLKWVMSVRDPSSRLARWNLHLQEYCFEVEHKSGKTHLNADALSRTAAVAAIDEFVPVVDPAELRTEQCKDPDLKRIIESLEGAPSHPEQLGYFIDKDGTLCRRTRPTRKGRLEKTAWERVVIPRSWTERVLRAFHDAPCAGHFGVAKTRRRVERLYFWSGMRQDVRDYCAKCHSCLERKTPKGRRPAPIQPFPEVSAPFERTAHESTGESPFFLLYGRDPDQPSEVPEGPRRVPYASLDDYKVELESRLQVARDIAKESLKKAAKRRKEVHDRSARDAPFDVGDSVYIENCQRQIGLARKFQTKWRGPCEVVEKLSPVNFRVRDVNRRLIRIHANRLKSAPVQYSRNEERESADFDGDRSEAERADSSQETPSPAFVRQAPEVTAGMPPDLLHALLEEEAREVAAQITPGEAPATSPRESQSRQRGTDLLSMTHEGRYPLRNRKAKSD
ncbi:hypothetical protein V5799_008101 [Amblyomma americanum]|uniref:RNA-directed DNA polymerase n=1 Tax=Amblyomma americanum TaxID=6943 RepID=A0AAQ4FFF0_AMBAM